jgi:hypothetical protein
MKKIYLMTYISLLSIMISGCQINDHQDDMIEGIDLSYKIVDTNQTDFYSDISIIIEPNQGDDYDGQDANYIGNQASYTDHEDGTISDHVTGLMWAQDMGEKMTYEDAFEYAESSTLGGYDDWRVPSIKELYSLIQFDGQVNGETAIDLFIDTNYFNQPLGDTSIGEREIDAQTWSSTMYVGLTMNGDETVFGVNFIDGRIKGYPTFNKETQEEHKLYVRLVRGNEDYGKNIYQDNGDGTVTDLATGLTWQQYDSVNTYDWEGALAYAENLEFAGYDDWRLPNAKELQSIVDYNKSLQTTNSAAIDDIFESSTIIDYNGNINYGYYWTSTTHLDGMNPYASAVYIAFGEAQGVMNGSLLDVHGAGAQRSDPKSGNPDDYPISFGPQGDIRYVYNLVRCVRG